MTTGEGWLYPAFVLYVASRRIVGWIEGSFNRTRVHTSINFQAPGAADIGQSAA